MRIEDFVKALDADFFTGVPDSQLKSLCNWLYKNYGIDGKHHIIAANEGNAVAIAAGYYLATGEVPVVYMQNSGEGNIINPVASLLNDKVYAIPMIFVIGWRGEPGVHDEPQHIYQGEITVKLLEDMGISYRVIDKDTSPEAVMEVMKEFRSDLEKGLDVAFVIRKGALIYDGKVDYGNGNTLVREQVIERIVDTAKEDPIVCTTGKASRELFEIREKRGEDHRYDFLTVGSMGHSSSIALGIALNSDKRIWCIDGDGAALMHLGAMAVIGNNKPENMVHVVINNGAHETVGGMPTVAGDLNIAGLAEDLGYERVYKVSDREELDKVLKDVKGKTGLCLIEVRCAIGSRVDLGRPTTSPAENKEMFVSYLRKGREDV